MFLGSFLLQFIRTFNGQIAVTTSYGIRNMSFYQYFDNRLIYQLFLVSNAVKWIKKAFVTHVTEFALHSNMNDTKSKNIN